MNSNGEVIRDSSYGGGVKKKPSFLQGSQAYPARPSARSIMKMKIMKNKKI